MKNLFKKKYELPEKLSTLLEQALEDLEKTEKNPKYRVDMGHWHSPVEELDADYNPHTYCSVCLAGSFLANRYGPPEGLEIDAHDAFSLYGRDVGNAMTAINYARMGLLRSALIMWHAGSGSVYPVRDMIVTPYRESPSKFKRDMEKAIAKVKEIESEDELIKTT